MTHATLATLFFALTAASAATLPAGFQPNAGRFDPRISFVAQGREYGVSLEPSSVRFLLTGKDHKPGAVVLRFPGSRSAQAAADGPSLGHINYFIGDDPARWARNLDEYRRVRYSNLYDGIDLALYENGGRLEHDFIVQPGADPAAIALAFSGAKAPHLSSDGALLIGTPRGELRFEPPGLYQEIGGQKTTVQGRYRLDRAARIVHFDVGAYDRTRLLVIDPTVAFTVNLTGSGVETGTAVTSDAQGNMYIAGVTTSMDLQLLNPARSTYGGGIGDGFVAKWDPTGNLIYATYLGGSSQDQPQQILVDAQGNAVVLGFTHSPDFPGVNPLPSGGYPPPNTDPLNGKPSSFISKLDPTGSKLVYSTLLWSNNLETYNSTGIALDSAGNAYVTGFDALLQAPSVSSPRLTPTSGAYKSPNVAVGSNHVWVAKLSTAGALVWNAVIGGSKQEQASGIDVDSSGAVYVAGSTSSADFPVTPNNGVQQTLTSKGGGNAFLAVLNPAGSQIVYGTYFGGSGTDVADTVAVFPGVGVGLGGLTTSPDLPVTPGALQSTLTAPNTPNGFLAALTPATLTVPPSANAKTSSHTTQQPAGVRASTYTPKIVTKIYYKRGTVNEGSSEEIDTEYYYAVQRDSGTGKVVKILAWSYLSTPLEDLGEAVYFLLGRSPFAFVHPMAPVEVTPPPGQDFDAFINELVGEGYFQLDTTGSTQIPHGQAGPQAAATAASSLVGTRLSLSDLPNINGVAVVNAASFAPPSVVAPGEIVTIYGTSLGPAALSLAQLDSTGQKLSTSVAGTQVLFDDVPAPIVYTSAGQVSAIVPYGVQSPFTAVRVSYNGALGNIALLGVAPSAPGIFTADGKQAAALNQDTSYNSASNPAARGSTVVLFTTGEGQTNPPGVDGQIANSVYPKPVLPVSVMIGGQPASVAYYGAAPGLTAGLMQLNLVVPQNIQPGEAAVVLTVGTANSQAGVTITVN